PRVHPIDEEWMNMKDAALYIGRTRVGLADAISRYERQTGKIIEKENDGQYKMMRKRDIDDMIRAIFPVIAMQKGLV
ncbi:MAG TPA: hypothetical protein VEL31_16235, partial [Ktedonobacteraceae bacterium]|nr:hypothetical protein [Ktedonobacteraceae bacterium]